jgi:rhamnose transport system permease protein
MSDPFKAFPRTDLLGLPVMSWIAIAAVLFFSLVMTRTTLGRAFYAVGGNPHAATYAGIDVGRTQFWAFTISGALAGLTGYLWVSRFAVAYVDIAGGFELGRGRRLRDRRRRDHGRYRHRGAPCWARCSSASSRTRCRS